MTEEIVTGVIVTEETVTSARTTDEQPQFAQSGEQPNSAQSNTGQSSTGQPSAPQTIERASLRKDRDDGITLLALYNFVLAGAFLLGTVFVALPAGITAIVGIVQDPGALIATLILGVIAFVLMTFCILFLVVAYGLWTMRQWARVAAIALAMLSLFAVPLGTIIGGVTIWYLIKPEVAEQFV